MRIVTTDEQARKAVREDKEAGYIGIKVYNQLSGPVYKAIVAEAAEQHIPIMGTSHELWEWRGRLRRARNRSNTLAASCDPLCPKARCKLICHWQKYWLGLI
jgi:hypothetical protein